jgi:tetratricopeptide (TPR) repeat protein
VSNDRDEALTIIHTQVVGDTQTAANDTPRPNAAWGLDRGTALGRYIILDKIGTGGMSAVYAAYDPELDRKVAIKLLHPDPTGSGTSEGTATSRTRLLREAQAMAKLSHPNIVRVFDVGTWQGEVFIAMEIVDGGSLKEWLAEKPRTWQEVRETMLQAGRGLAAAHAAGLVHRDFKPENLLIGRETNRAYVVDFGLVHPDAQRSESSNAAQPAATEQSFATDPGIEGSTTQNELVLQSDTVKTSELTQLGTIMGTPPYMAPEQHRGERTETRTDQFSFAVTLFEAFYGERPFKGKSLNELRSQVLAGKYTFPEGRKVPAWIQKIIRRGLSVEITERYPSMDALLEELSTDPAAKRRRIAAIATAATTLIGGAIAYPQLRPEPVIPCQESAGLLAAVWNPARRKDMENQVASLKAPFVQETWKVVSTALDDYARNWETTHREACEATEVRGEQSRELEQRRMECLDVRLRDFNALASELENGNAELWGFARNGVHSLRALQECSDAQALSAQQAVPTSEELRRGLDQLWDDLSHVRALGMTGQPQAIMERANALIRKATDLEHSPTIADTYMEVGKAQLALGEPIAAVKSLNEALWAAEASHYDRVAALAAIHLIAAKGRKIADGPGIEYLVAHAQATMIRYGEDADLEQRLLAARVDLAEVRGRPYQAEALLSDITALEAQRRKKGDVLLDQTLFDVADQLAATGETESARVLYETGIANIESVLGAQHPETAKGLMGLGALALAAGDRETAEKKLNGAFNLVTQTHDPEGASLEKAKASFLLAQAKWEKNPEEAVELATAARTILTRGWPGEHDELESVERWLLGHPWL